MTHTISFFVPGIPAPGGSKKFVGFAKSTGRAILVDAAGQRNKDWRASVATVAAACMSGVAPLEGPLAVRLTFLMPRPKGHRKPSGDMRNGAPMYPTSRPDALKLARSAEDAMTGIVWRDDAQTVRLEAEKHYADGRACGCEVTVQTL